MHSTEDGTDYIGGTLHSTGGNMNSVGGDATHTEEGALSEKQAQMYIRTVNVMCSMRSFSTPGPYSSLNMHMIRVFLPAPEGPYTSKWGKSPPWIYIGQGEKQKGELQSLHCEMKLDPIVRTF